MNKKFVPNEIKLTVASDPKWMALVRSVVSKIAARMNFKRGQIKKMVLAVDEACTNVVRYAYLGNNQKEIIVCFRIFDDRLEILIKDFGRKSDPETFKSRDLKDIKPGGLGIHFINKVMDEVKYDTSLPAGTELCLVKYKKRRMEKSYGSKD
ncbi:MAG: ATP-binding protein [Candidatus Omnitrophota bacterium]|nr:ATP-binding protein [Candidatus Omnitrophota bacterium]